MSGSTYYDRSGQLIGDAFAYSEWIDALGQDEFDRQHRVGLMSRDDVTVSTVWLGLNHQWGDGPPLIFETMVFGGEHDQLQERYSTEAQALAGHAEICSVVLS